MTSRLRRHALRIALISTAVVAGLTVALCVAIDVIVAQTLRSSATTRLTARAHASLPGNPVARISRSPTSMIQCWSGELSSVGTIVAATPVRRRSRQRRSAHPSPSETQHRRRRCAGRRRGIPAGRLIGAVSLGNESNAITALAITEAVVGPVLLVLVFAGSFVVGRQTAGPIERARRRQLEFTADASHELRTPLAVIEAETSLALANPATHDADDRNAAPGCGRDAIGCGRSSRICSGSRGSTRSPRIRPPSPSTSPPPRRLARSVSRPSPSTRGSTWTTATTARRSPSWMLPPTGSIASSACCSTTRAGTRRQAAR